MRPPAGADGAAVWSLIRDVGTLDLNSPYCYLLLTEHFASTSVLATVDGVLAGSVLGYRKPADRQTLFVWQVAVSVHHRRKGLALRMLRHLAENVTSRHIEASVTPGNLASRQMFQALAHTLDADIQIRPWLEADRFPDGDHEAEDLIRIGPIQPP